EVGAPVEFTADPPNRKIEVSSLKGNFLFGRSGAATGVKSIPDQVTLGGRITLPAGLKLDHDQEVHVAVGNVIDRIVLSAKGKGQGKFAKLGLKGGKAAADGTKEGKFSVSMRLAGMTNQ